MKLRLLCLFLSLLAGTTSFGQKDTMGLKQAVENFYTDTSGNVYFKNLIPDDNPHHRFSIRFQQTMPLTDWENWDTLKKFIHLETYHKVKDVYAADTNYVYYFIYNSDGTTMRILQNADPTTFRHVKSDIAKDKNYIFKDGCLVEGADPAGKIKVYPGEYSNAPYFTDGKKVFYNCREVEGADVATFKTILHEADYDAEDKNQKYLSGKPI